MSKPKSRNASNPARNDNLQTVAGEHLGIRYQLRARGAAGRLMMAATLPDGTRARVSTHTSDLSTAHATAHAFIAAQVGVSQAPPEPTRRKAVRAPRGNGNANGKDPAWTLADAYKRTLALRWKGTRGERTATENAATVLNHFGADTPVRDITTDGVDGLVAALEARDLSGATVNRKLAALSLMLRIADERGHIDRLPQMHRRRERTHRIRYLTDDEESMVDRLLRADGHHAVADVVTFLLDTGMRRGEALRLEVRDVELGTGTLHLWETKTDQPRSLPMTPRVRALLAPHVDGKPPTALVWSKVSKRLLRARWEAVRTAMGLRGDEYFVVHALRHTCASRLVQRGVPLAVVQKWLGHSAVTTTMRYAHLAPDSLSAAVQALSEHAGEASAT